ncbi:uncharacterized protein LOC143852860 [Tasmannia lanceolata]|uniref:uncharacterized protein LOC143852860 n=1 Tax=Tasmannia lanceolata TaxID=3420 RepID=UPI0040649EF6
MASGHCVALCTPFSVHALKAQKESDGTCQQIVVLDRVSSRATARMALKFLRSKSLIISKFAVNRGQCTHLLTPCRHTCGPLYGRLTVLSSIHLTIFGYWVGPDIEDGWGYVEAAVNLVPNQ